MVKIEEESWLQVINLVDAKDTKPLEFSPEYKGFIAASLLRKLGINHESSKIHDPDKGTVSRTSIEIPPRSIAGLPTLLINIFPDETGPLQYALRSSDPKAGLVSSRGEPGFDLRTVKIVLDSLRGEEGENFDLYFSEKDRLLRIGLPQSRHQQQAIPLGIGGDNYHIVGLQFIPDLSPRTIINGTVGFLTT